MPRSSFFVDLNCPVECSWHLDTHITVRLFDSRPSLHSFNNMITIFLEGDEHQLRNLHRILGQAIEQKWPRNK
jgi:hypothetical protein